MQYSSDRETSRVMYRFKQLHFTFNLIKGALISWNVHVIVMGNVIGIMLFYRNYVVNVMWSVWVLVLHRFVSASGA